MVFLTNEEASCSSAHRWNYDVFLSFRGEDTRKNFTGYLYEALYKQGFNIFIDKDLQKGEEISMELLKAIESSMISIVVFSKSFASSTWCLNELVKIFECRSNGQSVLPIFYKVNPSEIRKQDGEFGIALAKHEEQFKDDIGKVQRWRKTLFEAANLSGFHYNDSCVEFEFEFIQKVINKISTIKSNHMPLFVAQHLVGMDTRAQAIELLLDMESNDACMVGIYGLGGVGKTTVSKVVYNRFTNLFEGSCFLENVREMSEKNSDKILLQKTLLSKILDGTNLNVYNISEGTNLIMERLHGKKVLLILDDVGDLKDVENLLGKYNWFAPGSRVIITTRNKQVLTSLGIDHRRIHKVEELRQCEARELFIKHAFQASEYGEDYSEFVEQIICYANGLPLALKIIGSDLCGKKIHEWKSALEKYKNIPHKNIQEILKISYDGLENFEKEIFLDIACFFKGYNKDDVANILDSCKLYPDYGIRKLIDKCLITLKYVSWYNSLSMHDLVQQMGKEIVQQESEELEQHSRIWRYEDAHKLLTRNMGSDKIRGIMLCSPEPTKIALEANVFKRMKNLKFLIGNVHNIGEALEYLPDELRVLEWREFPLSLSSKCCLPQQLVVLKMYNSNIILENVVKQGFEYENLKMISLISCEFITKLPDLCCPNLEELDLSNCINLIEVHESIGLLEKLKKWRLRGCSQLQILPSTLMLKSLTYFHLSLCSRLEKFPNIHPEMNCLRALDLTCSGIRELPSSLLYLTRLDDLSLSGSELTNFPVGANKSQMREEEDIPSAKLRLPCNSFNNFSGPTGFQNMTFLSLRHCRRIESGLDSWMQPDYFPVLTDLYLSYTDIVTIPESISKFTKLRLLEIQDCKKLRKIPRLPQSIRTVDAQNCYRLDTQSSSRLWNQFGEILGFLPNTIAQAATSFRYGFGDYLLLPAIEIPKWLEFNHHQSVGNSVSFLVGPKFSDLAICIAIPSKDIGYVWEVHVFINGKEQFTERVSWANGNYDHVWLIMTSLEVYISNPENLIEVKVTPRFSVRMLFYGECICCPQKPNISPASSMDQCAFNNGEEDSGRVGIRRRLQRRNHRPTHARCPQKHYLSCFGWLRIRYRLWKPSSKPWRRRITNGFHDQGSSSIPNTLSMMIPRPILLHCLNPTLRRR